MDEHSKAEVEMRFNSIEKRFDEQDKILGEIRAQTVKTNGRITDLELTRAKQDGFNKAIAIFGSGSWAICVAVIGWMLMQLFVLPDRVNTAAHSAVDDALKAYNVQVK